MRSAIGSLILPLSFHFATLPLSAATSTDTAHKKTVCLNMIVKDESKVIIRCLSSLKKYVDFWVIVDTGSTDGTQKIIREFMKDIPGELHERPWINFEHNRNEALVLAQNKADYVLFIDADEQLIPTEKFELPNLEKDCYVIQSQASNMNFHRVLLVNNHPEWKWSGVVHETLTNPQAKNSEVLSEIKLLALPDGNRNQDPKKYQKDAALLQEALQKDPTNRRYVFYLAQSYWECKDYPLALKYYEQRAGMEGSSEEVFWSLFCIAGAQQMLKMAPEIVINSYIKAYQFDPRRAEPLYRLAVFFRLNENYFLAYLVANFALSLPQPKVNMFSENWMYDYGLLEELAAASYSMGKYAEAQNACNLLLSKSNVPQSVRLLAKNNLQCILTKLASQRSIDKSM